jgi:Undecaprenyl-phosphate galactose phosphotransferase WbaP
LSTPQANETSNQHAAAARVPVRRPHLVSTTEVRLHSEAARDAGLETEGGIEVPAAGFNFPESPARTALSRSARRAEMPTGAAAVAKRLLDVIGAVILGLVFSPLILVIVLLMRKGDGSVIYRHRRVGRGGRMFSCLKFRTMIPNAEQVLSELLETHPELKAEWVRDHKLRHDPRVTRLGRFLRRTSLDELPQLVNVLRGEMSLVGPRPVIREELLRYGRSVDIYLAAKPGITGLWQVTGRNNTDYRRRVVLDTYYVRNQNLLLDIFILAKTTGVVLGGNGAY